MKKVLTLFVILMALLVDTGCKDNVNKDVSIDNNGKSESIEVEGKLSKDDFNEFITNYFNIYCGLRGNQFRFWNDYYNDERVKKMIEANNSDIPAMRFLGKQGLNDLEISEAGVKLNKLNKNEISENFPNSAKDLNDAKKFLERFFQGSKDLLNFEEFQTDVSVDLLTYRNIMEGLQYSLTNECDFAEYIHPEFFEGDTIKNFCNAEETCNFLQGHTLDQEHFKDSL